MEVLSPTIPRKLKSDTTPVLGTSLHAIENGRINSIFQKHSFATSSYHGIQRFVWIRSFPIFCHLCLCYSHAYIWVVRLRPFQSQHTNIYLF